MKKIKLLFAGIIITALSLTSCSSNESAVEAPQSVVFAKTTEMLNFERSLKCSFIPDFEIRPRISAVTRLKSRATPDSSRPPTLLFSVLRVLCTPWRMR